MLEDDFKNANLLWANFLDLYSVLIQTKYEIWELNKGFKYANIEPFVGSNHLKTKMLERGKCEYKNNSWHKVNTSYRCFNEVKRSIITSSLNPR